MPRNDRLNSTRRHLAVLIERGARVVPDDPTFPKKWWFGTVKDPRSSEYFTAEGAWSFTAEKLRESGCKVKEVILDKPPGRKAYELRVRTSEGTIYIKVHFGGQGKTVIGRSFHYLDES